MNDDALDLFASINFTPYLVGGQVDIPQSSNYGADGGCLFTSRWEGSSFFLDVTKLTVNARRFNREREGPLLAAELDRALKNSTRLEYLDQLSYHAKQGHCTIGATFAIESEATTAAGVADDMVAWLCDVYAFAIQEDILPQEAREWAKTGPVLPPGFSPAALVPPDPRPYTELMDRYQENKEWRVWQNRWMPFILPVVENTPATETVDLHCKVRTELRRVRAQSVKAENPDVTVAASLRSLAGGKADAAPVPPVAEDRFAPTNAPLSEKLYGEAEQAVEDARRDREEAEQAKSKPAPPKPPLVPLPPDEIENLLRNWERFDKDAERAKAWLDATIEEMGELAACGYDFLRGLKDGAIEAECENWEGIAELIQNFFAWRLYQIPELSAFVDLSRFKEGYDAIEELFAALRALLADPQGILAELEGMLAELEELAGRAIDDPLGEIQKLVETFFAEFQAAAALWGEGQYYESGKAYGKILWDTLSELLWVFGKVKQVAKMAGKVLSPNVAFAMERGGGNRGRNNRRDSRNREDIDRNTAPRARRTGYTEDGKLMWGPSEGRDAIGALRRHYRDHNRKFKNPYGSIEEYAEAAYNFVNGSSGNMLHYRRKNGQTVFFNTQSKRFAVSDANGMPTTFFEPTDGRDFYERLKRKDKRAGRIAW